MNTNRFLVAIAMIVTMLLCGTRTARADALDTLQAQLTTHPQVQEKIYIHTDNSSYFIGDTLWYKAYVTRADQLVPTNISKLLYVELITSDGYLVERQHVVVSATGATCGQFYLPDSLYSGFYEIRAYTRYQLNFNYVPKDYTPDDRLKFYGETNANTFFRQYEGLYSRVVPVFERPEKAGDFSQRYMAHRPKQRVLKDKYYLKCAFYPEGGSLVAGVSQRVAFELTDQSGEQMDLEGTLSDGQRIRPSHMGRGVFTVTPSSQRQSVTFEWNGKTYTFRLPDASDEGTVVTLDVAKGEALLASNGVTPAAYSVLCRGRVVKFERINGDGVVQLPMSECPTGVNEIIVYDSDANPLASRLFFVNHHDIGMGVDVTLTSGGETVDSKTTLAAYAPIDVSVSVPQQTAWHGALSLAIRDAQTDERGYDNGNIMTDMLLSSELRGFIASPAYYFESDDAQHTADLDLLMMVQGWRRYKRVEQLIYAPERELTFEGQVRKVPAMADMLELTDLEDIGGDATTVADQMMEEMERVQNLGSGTTFLDNGEATSTETEDETSGYGIDTEESDTEEETVEYAEADYKLSDGRPVRGVLVEAELSKDGEVAGAITTTDNRGRFKITLPPYYDQAILFVKAYTRRDSLKKNMQALGDKNRMNERAYPDFFVQRDLFFPIFTEPFSWYQVNSPELLFVDEDDDSNIPANSRLAGNHMLQTVVVKAKRRGKRSVDMTKPAIVWDAYRAYNDVTDAGLLFGVVDFKRLPMAIATYYFGNMGRRNQFNIRALVDGTSFYRNYTPSTNEYDRPAATSAVYEKLRLNRIQNIRLFTDYELRTDSGDVVETNAPDVTIDFQLIPDDGKRYTYRDRRYVLDGLTYAEEFYSPDYSMGVPSVPEDYRRTLYWNPNVPLSDEGTFQTRFFNNARETRVTVSAAGMDTSGQMYYR